MWHKRDDIQTFRTVTGLLKDFGWWIALLLAGGALMYSFFGDYTANVVAHTIAGGLLVYSTMRAVSYRRRTKRIYQAFQFFHKLTHEIRDQLGNELEHLSNADEKLFESISEDESSEAEEKTLKLMIQKILNDTAYAFRELSGRHCTAVLLMPEHDNDHGRYFLARQYSSDTSNERIESKQRHKGGLVLNGTGLSRISLKFNRRKAGPGTVRECDQTTFPDRLSVGGICQGCRPS